MYAAAFFAYDQFGGIVGTSNDSLFFAECGNSFFRPRNPSALLRSSDLHLATAQHADISHHG